MISILIPLYNAEHFIIETVESCLNQNFEDYEIIVVDDCSQDNSFMIVKEFAEHNDKIKIYRNDVNMGLIATVNNGIQYCVGDYIIVLGNDDTLKPNHLSIMNRIISSNKYSFVYCGSDYINEDSKKIGVSDTTDVNARLSLLGKKNVINSCGLIINKQCLKSVGGYPNYLGYRNYGEWYLWILLLSKKPAFYTEEIRSNYRIHSNNLTKSLFKRDNYKKTRDYNLKCMKLASTTLGFSKLTRVELFCARVEFYLKSAYRIYIKRG